MFIKKRREQDGQRIVEYRKGISRLKHVFTLLGMVWRGNGYLSFAKPVYSLVVILHARTAVLRPLFYCWSPINQPSSLLLQKVFLSTVTSPNMVVFRHQPKYGSRFFVYFPLLHCSSFASRFYQDVSQPRLA